MIRFPGNKLAFLKRKSVVQIPNFPKPLTSIVCFPTNMFVLAISFITTRSTTDTNSSDAGTSPRRSNSNLSDKSKRTAFNRVYKPSKRPITHAAISWNEIELFPHVSTENT